MSQPLRGLLVVALEQAVAAPYCSSRLADAGARVIKIERADGDFARGYDRVAKGESAYFVWINRGKESLVLDLKDRADQALLGRIVARADVFLQNLGPGAAARAGFGSEDLRARHPRLITCDISGYGEEGPYRDMKAYDLLVQGEVGLAAITGSPAEPGRVGVSVADIACGMYAHTAILQALLERERTGKGAGIAVSLFDALADWMAVPLMHLEYGGKAPERVGVNHPSIAPYGAFTLKDGRRVILSIQNEREWQQFCALVLEHHSLAADPRYADNSRRVANRPQLDELVAAIFAQLDWDEASRRLNAARIAFGALNGVDGLSVHPQLRRVMVSTPSGDISIPAPPARVAGEAFSPGPVPALGAQSAALRAEFED